MMPVRLEPAAPRSPVKHSTTEPLRSLSAAAAVVIGALGLNDAHLYGLKLFVLVRYV